MANFNKSWCSVIVKDGMHFVITPNGNEIPAVVTTITNDTTGAAPQCTLTIFCNIVKDLQDAINQYEN